MKKYVLTNADIVTPDGIVKNGKLAVSGKNLDMKTFEGSVIDLNDEYIVYPALINAHDHMRGNYLPRVGPPPGEYYLHWGHWDKDLKASNVYSERANINVFNGYKLSAYKNLFSGVTTVNDHFPHEWNEPFIPYLPITVMSKYALAHECSSFDLKWGDGIEVEHKKAVRYNMPFITHLEEGFDSESQRGVEILEELKCLDEYTVLIHCIGFSDEDIKKVNKAGSHVVWCPASNMFMFNVTCKIRDILEEGINVSIGTDSTHTGGENILEEMRYAAKTYRYMYGEDLDHQLIYKMVTENPAKAMRIYDSVGSLENGKHADIMVLKKKHENAYTNLLNAQMSDIALLTIEGTPIYGEDKFSRLLKKNSANYTTIKVGGLDRFVKGDPAGLMREVHEAVGFKKELAFMPFSV